MSLRVKAWGQVHSRMHLLTSEIYWAIASESKKHAVWHRLSGVSETSKEGAS